MCTDSEETSRKIHQEPQGDSLLTNITFELLVSLQGTNTSKDLDSSMLPFIHGDGFKVIPNAEAKLFQAVCNLLAKIVRLAKFLYATFWERG
jgi:hypothetical protein